MYVSCKFPPDDPGDASRQLKSQFIQLRITIIYPAMFCPDFVRTIWRSDIELLSLQTSPHDLVIHMLNLGIHMLSDKVHKKTVSSYIKCEAADLLLQIQN